MVILKYWKLIVGVIMALSISYLVSQNNKLEVKYISATANAKAYAQENRNYSQENSKLKDKNRTYEFTVDQMRSYYSDSINKILINGKNKLKIKDKDIKELQYYKENFRKTDTLFIKGDTVFAPGIDIDTTLQDSGYILKLQLKYPSTLIVDPKFTNEKEVFVHSSRETVEPAKKFFIARWFQKKQTVLLIDVIDSNPYIENEETRFIKILQKN